jgi:hypothetical protein
MQARARCEKVGAGFFASNALFNVGIDHVLRVQAISPERSVIQSKIDLATMKAGRATSGRGNES